MADTWIAADAAMELTNWKNRWLREQASTGTVTSRAAAAGANGKPKREFLLSSLPQDAQLKYAEQAAKVSGAIARPEIPSSELQAPNLKAARKRVIVPESLQPMVERKLEGLAPLIEYHSIASAREQREFLQARGAANFTALADQAGAACGQSARTLLRWFALYKSDGEPGLAGKIRGDRGTSRYFEDHAKAAAFVQNAYLGEGLNVRHIFDILRRRWAEIGESGDAPGYQTIRRYTQAIPKPVGVLAREGGEKLTAKCGPYILRAAPPAMRWWISDHRVHDVFVHNTAFEHEPFGKMYRLQLTAVYDWGSRKIVGCVWSPQGNSQTINAAVRMGVAQCGFPQNLYWDNGKDYQAVARTLTALLERQDVSITSALPFSPRSKPIEAYFTRWSFRFDRLFRPAYAGNKPSNCPPECREAQKLHAQWLAGKRETTPLPNDKEFILRALQFAVEYNDTPHDSLNGRTPNQVFDEQFPSAQRQPVDRRLLDQLFWRRDKRKVLAGGCVEADKLRYEPTEESFGELAMMCGRDVAVCRDPYDLGEAIALDAETGEFLGELRVQERVEQAPHGRLTQDAIRAAMRRARGFARACKQYGMAIEAIAANAGWKPERDALLDRARGAMTGTDGRELNSQNLLRGAAPGAGGAGENAPLRASRALPALAPAFVSDGVDDDFGPVELEK